MSRKLFPVRIATAALVAAAALTAAGATEASAAPQYQTLTALNGGKVLATQNGAAVTTPAQQPPSGAQQFELLFPGSAGSSEPGFGSAFQLKNKVTGKCLRDNGPGTQVSEVNCFPNPSVDSTQLWQHKVATDREVGGKRWFFVFNRHTDRVLSQEPVFGTTIRVLSSVPAGNVGSAAAAHQLWNFQRV